MKLIVPYGGDESEKQDEQHVETQVDATEVLGTSNEPVTLQSESVLETQEKTATPDGPVELKGELDLEKPLASEASDNKEPDAPAS